MASPQNTERCTSMARLLPSSDRRGALGELLYLALDVEHVLGAPCLLKMLKQLVMLQLIAFFGIVLMICVVLFCCDILLQGRSYWGIDGVDICIQGGGGF